MEFSFNIIEDYDDNIIIKQSIKKRSRLICEEKEEIIEEKTTDKNFQNKSNRPIDIFIKNKHKYGDLKDTGKDYNSISYIVKKQLSQSQSIKLGIIMEKVLTDLILESNSNLKSIKPKNESGKKEKDHLFMDENNKIIYYSEIKSNLNLDTEKSKETSNKCIDIYNTLIKKYKNYKVNMYLVGIRYFVKEIIPKNIINKYDNISEHVVGVNEYLSSLNCNIKFNEDEYIEYINDIVNHSL